MTKQAASTNKKLAWRTNQRGQVPLSVKLNQLAFRLLGPVAPGLMSRWAALLWSRTHRFEPPRREQRMQMRASEYSLKVKNTEIKAWEWGSGPAVLLVHGWNGRGMQLGNFIDPLMKAGYRVITFDAPGHGQTRGHRTNLIEIRDILLALSDREQGFHTAIGHSFGVACLSAAIHAGMPVSNLVAISTPGSLSELVSSYCQAMYMPEAVEAGLHQRLAKRFEASTWDQFAHHYPLSDSVQNVLVVHDRDDEVVDWHEAQKLVADWPNARLHLTEGLGHRRILRNAKLIRYIVEFIDSDPLGDSLDEKIILNNNHIVT